MLKLIPSVEYNIDVSALIFCLILKTDLDECRDGRTPPLPTMAAWLLCHLQEIGVYLVDGPIGRINPHICWLSFSSLAMPKSASSAQLGEGIRILAGLISRWITPWECAYVSALSTWPISRSDSIRCDRLAEHVAQRDATIDILHNKVQQAIMLAEIIDWEDIVMLERGNGTGLTLEARGELWVAVRK